MAETFLPVIFVLSRLARPTNHVSIPKLPMQMPNGNIVNCTHNAAQCICGYLVEADVIEVIQ